MVIHAHYLHLVQLDKVKSKIAEVLKINKADLKDRKVNIKSWNSKYLLGCHVLSPPNPHDTPIFKFKAIPSHGKFY